MGDEIIVLYILLIFTSSANRHKAKDLDGITEVFY